MSDLRPRFAALLALEMRAPLARIELLASQLRRETATPRAHHLGHAISEAVGELDRLIGRSLEVLVPDPVTSKEEEDLLPVLAALRERVAPALAARGLRWESSPQPLRVSGDPERARQAAIHLLRAALASGPWNGSLRVDLIGDGPRYGVELVIQPSPPGCSLPELPDDLERFAVAQGGLLETSAGNGNPRLRLWLPRRVAA